MDCEYYDNGRCNLISNEFAEARCKEDETCVFRKPQEYHDWVDVIRCKDCKYWHREIHNGIEYFNFSSCDLNHCGDGHNFYCADAERRES